MEPEQEKTRKKEDQKRRRQAALDAGIVGAQTDTVQRYGAGIKEHLVGYAGVDNEAQKTLAKGLKQIAQEKVNPDYAERNIKQQAGFSAEVKTQARESAEKAIRGEKNRVVRTDDMKSQPDGRGHTIGGKNEQLYDLAEVGKGGIYIEGSGRQLKFVGGNGDQCFQRIMQKKFDKYREADVPIEVPSDFYDSVQQNLVKRAESLQKQIAHAESKGDTALADAHRAKLAKVQKTQTLLRKGRLTNDEALFARQHPVLSTGADITKVAHRGGMEAAKSGAIIGGSASIVKNLVAVVRQEKEFGEAARDVAVDTGGAAALSYGTGFVGSALKGAMQNAPSETVRTLSKTNLAGIAVNVAVTATKTLKRYYDGEIDGVECLEELGEDGTGMLVSGLFSVVGTSAATTVAAAASASTAAIGAAALVGGLAGGMLGYAVASASYRILVDALKEEKLAAEERLRIETECAQQIELIRAYRMELEQAIGAYLLEQVTVFQSAFDDIKTAMALGDIDGFIAGANSISLSLGREPQFGTMEEFDALMGSDVPFTL